MTQSYDSISDNKTLSKLCCFQFRSCVNTVLVILNPFMELYSSFYFGDYYLLDDGENQGHQCAASLCLFTAESSLPLVGSALRSGRHDNLVKMFYRSGLGILRLF